jgi:hypothetical protein
MFFYICFHSFIQKPLKSGLEVLFNFALRESQLLKKNYFLDPALWFGFWLLEDKSQNQKSNKHTLINSDLASGKAKALKS